MTLENDWEEVVSEVRSSYPDRKIVESEDSIEVNFGPSTFLTIRKNGFIEGSMPKHHFETDDAEEVSIDNGITTVKGSSFEYLFKEL